MKISFLSLFILAASAIAALTLLPTDSVAPANLIEIQGEKYFNDWTTTENHDRATLVYFYASWSPVCKQFMKEYGKVANHFALKEYQEQVMITKMDAPNFPHLSRSLGLESFPTIWLYSMNEVGKYEKYEGELEANELIEWLEKKLHKKMRKNGLPIPKKKKKRGII